MGPDSALDAEDHLVGVLGVLGEVGLQEGQGVALGRAVELAAVSEVHALVKGRTHGLEGLLLRNGVRTPGEACTWSAASCGTRLVLRDSPMRP
jgi:hypothetical protein